MNTAAGFVKSALRKIASYQSGEQVGGIDTSDCLEILNDMLDSWSTTESYVFGVTENIVQWIAGQNLYNIGNPLSSDIGFAPFGAMVTIGSTILTPTNIPSNLDEGATVFSAQNLFPPATIVTAIDPIGLTVTLNNMAIASSQGTDSISYTIPGDFSPPFGRPLMITSGYTRFNQLDFSLDVYETEEEYNAVLYKAQPGPWPVVAWYNNTFPYGQLRVYQTPGNSAELHLFTRTILGGNLQANSPMILPQGYARAVKLNLARELWIEYVSPATVPTQLEKLADEALRMIKQLNARPPKRSTYDAALVQGNKRGDYGWIMHGGYR